VLSQCVVFIMIAVISGRNQYPIS